MTTVTDPWILKVLQSEEEVDPEGVWEVHRREWKGFHCRYAVHPSIPSALGYLNHTPVALVGGELCGFEIHLTRRTHNPFRYLPPHVIIKFVYSAQTLMHKCSGDRQILKNTAKPTVQRTLEPGELRLGPRELGGFLASP